MVDVETPDLAEREKDSGDNSRHPWFFAFFWFMIFFTPRPCRLNGFQLFYFPPHLSQDQPFLSPFS